MVLETKKQKAEVSMQPLSRFHTSMFSLNRWFELQKNRQVLCLPKIGACALYLILFIYFFAVACGHQRSKDNTRDGLAPRIFYVDLIAKRIRHK